MTELEQFRVSCLDELRSSGESIACTASHALGGMIVSRVWIIGSALSRVRFTEESDVDVAVAVIDDATTKRGSDERLSEVVQKAFLRVPFSFGTLNAVVLVNGFEFDDNQRRELIYVA